MEELPVLDRTKVVKDGYLAIPGSGVKYALTQLPEGKDLADELQNLLPDMQIWLLCALEYYRIGRSDDFRAILERTQLLDVYGSVTDDYGESPRVINALAGFYILQATSERDPQLRQDALHEVTKWISRANRLEQHVLTSTASAMSSLLSGKTDQAENYLDSVGDSTLATVLVRAMMHYAKGEYVESMKLFAKAIRTNPRCPAAVRFGLGLCYYRLDRKDLAEKCFLRALQLDNSLVEPRIAMGILKLNSGDLSMVKPAYELFQEAYEIDGTHPRLLNFFAEHYMVRRDFDKVSRAANKALQYSDNDLIKAECEYHLARVLHAKRDFHNARVHYQEAVARDPESPLAQFGLAQIMLNDGETEKATQCLEAVLKKYPEDFSTLQMIGTLYSRQGRVDEAKELLQRAIDADALDPETLLEFGLLFEIVEPAKSLMAYRSALKILTERGETAERLNQLRNNVGVVHHRLNHHDEALKMYLAVFGEKGDPSDHPEAVAVSITTSFNVARLYEDKGDLDRAERLYKAILALHVTYTDCYLRLATISRRRGHLDEAVQHLQDALTVHTDLPEALALQGNILIEKRELHAAQRKFERILEKVNRNDAYALISLGNIYYLAHSDSRERRERNMKFAAESFWKVLKDDHTNLYAANGLGIIFAAEGRLGAAGDIFTRVREGTNEMADVLVNLAHIYVARGEFLKAVTLYENALKKHFHGSHPKLELYLSRAYFEAKDWSKAEEYLNKCASHWSDRDTLKFNLALIREHKTLHLLSKLEAVSVEEAKTTKAEIEEAVAILKAIEAKGGEDEDEGSSLTKKASEHVVRCIDLVRKAQDLLTRAEDLRKHEEDLIKQREEKNRQRQIEKLEQERLKQEEAVRKAQELAAIAEKDMLVLREEMVHWKPLSTSEKKEKSSSSSSSSKKKSKTKKRETRDADEGEEEEEAPAEVDEKPVKAVKKTSSAVSSQISRKEEPEPDDDDDEDEMEDWQKATLNPKLAGLVQSKRVREERDKRGYGSKRRKDTEEGNALTSSNSNASTASNATTTSNNNNNNEENQAE